MKGTIYPRPFEKDPKTGARRPIKGKSTWTYQFWIPKADGGRRYITKGGFATKTAAQTALNEAMVDYGRSPTAVVEPSKLAIETYLLEEWLPTLHGLKSTTRQGYRDLVTAYVVPHLGDVRLCDLTPGQVAKFYDKLRTSGRRRPRKDVDGNESFALSESTVHHVHVALSAALGHAVEAGLLRTSPVATLPRKARPKVDASKRPEMKVWTVEECQTFLATAKGDRLGVAYELALATGLRRGELAGLRWADVDLAGAIVSVRRNTVTIGYDTEDGTPKGGRARTVDIDADTVTALKAHRKAQLEERMAWGEAWQDHGLVFTREDGAPVHPQTLLHHLRRLSRAAGVPEVRLHDLRHTHATLGLAAGVAPKVMQERLGHSSIQITLDLYSHVVPGMQADAAAKIGGLLRGVK